MGLMFCYGCGKEIHESASTCPHCGAPQRMMREVRSEKIPDGVKGWSWGAFWLTWIWGLSHRVWSSLLVFIPFFGFVMWFVLGFKGREWAWEKGRWESVEDFNESQRRWSVAGCWIGFGILFLGIFAAIAIPWYQDYIARSQTMRGYGEMHSVRTVIEICLNEGRLKAGQGEGECSIGYSCSDLLIGQKQDGSVNCKAGTGVPQFWPSWYLSYEVILTGTFGDKAAPILRDKTLVLKRESDGTWHCSDSTVPEKFLPSGCR
ncbi:MAG: pilin [Zoogloeaceae bacterium]|jgi:Tfp pilus assembly major pilin PilA|nr:pilin [Zoogloeaceae bacterium]